MIRNILIGTGAFISVLLGYVIFQVSGLCVACESTILQFILGFVLIALYATVFRSGVVNGKGRKRYVI